MRSIGRIAMRVRWIGVLAALGALIWAAGANWPHA